MKLLIIGASGKTGQKLLENLAMTKYSVTGLIRKPEQENMLKKFGAKAIFGDLENNIDELIKGFDAIIFVAGSRGKSIQNTDYQGLVRTVDAAVAAKIKRFLYIGSINAGKKASQFVPELEQYYKQNNECIPEGLLANTLKPGYSAYVEIKTRAEKHLIESGINYTILRAGLLTQEIGTGTVQVTLDTLNAFGKISRDNVAKCFIEVLENKNTFHKSYTILDGDTLIHEAF